MPKPKSKSTTSFDFSNRDKKLKEAEKRYKARRFAEEYNNAVDKSNSIRNSASKNKTPSSKDIADYNRSVNSLQNFYDEKTLKKYYNNTDLTNIRNNMDRMQNVSYRRQYYSAPKPTTTTASNERTSLEQDKKKERKNLLKSYFQTAVDLLGSPAGLQGSGVSTYTGGVSTEGVEQRVQAQKNLVDINNKLELNYAETIKNPDFKAKAKADEATAKKDNAYKYINSNKAQRDAFKAAAVRGGGTTGNVQLYDQMTAEQISIYNYLYKTEGKKAANEYLDVLAGGETGIKAYSDVESQYKQFTSKSPVVMEAVRLGSQIAEGVGGIMSNVASMTGNEQTANKFRQPSIASGAINRQITEDIDDWSKDKLMSGHLEVGGHDFGNIYTIGYNALDSYVRAAISGKVLGGSATAAFNTSKTGSRAIQALVNAPISMSAYGDSYYQARKSGKSDNEAKKDAFIDSAIEWTSEMLGGLFGFELKGGGAISQASNEGFEEITGNILQRLYDVLGSAFNGRESELEQEYTSLVNNGMSAKDAIKSLFSKYAAEDVISYASAFLPMAIGGGGQSGMQRINDTKIGKDIQSGQSQITDLPTLVNVASSLGTESTAYKTLEKSVLNNKNVSDATVGQLYRETLSDVQKQLNDASDIKELTNTMRTVSEAIDASNPQGANADEFTVTVARMFKSAADNLTATENKAQLKQAKTEAKKTNVASETTTATQTEKPKSASATNTVSAETQAITPTKTSFKMPVTANGNSSMLTSVESVSGDEGITFKTATGDSVKFTDVEFGDAYTDKVVTDAGTPFNDVTMGKNGANEYIRIMTSVSGLSDAEYGRYSDIAKMLYNVGRFGGSWQNVLNDDRLKFAVDSLGVPFSKAMVEAGIVDKELESASKSTTETETEIKAAGKEEYDNEGENEELDIIGKVLANITKGKVVLNADLNENGDFNINLDRIRVSATSSRGIGTLGHEGIGEYMRKYNPEGYELVVKVLLEYETDRLGAKAATRNTKAYYNAYKKVQPNTTMADAQAEKANDMIGALLFGNENGQRVFAKWLAERGDSKLINTFKDFIQKVIDVMNKYIKTENMTSSEKAALTARKQEAEQLAKFILEEYDKAVANKEQLVKEGKTEETGTETKMSLDVNEYMQAAKNGDEETAQKLVDEAAMRWGAYSVDGKTPLKLYHGTSNGEFYEFDTNRTGSNYGGYGRLGKGFYFAKTENVAKHWAEVGKGTKPTVIMPVYLNMGNTVNALDTVPQNVKDYVLENNSRIAGLDEATLEYNSRTLERFIGTYNLLSQTASEPFEDFGSIMQKLGYDGIYSDVEFMVYDANRIKSADAITYDNDGNVIPLSERFSESDDIRYSIDLDASDEKLNADYMDAVEKGDMKTAENLVYLMADRRGFKTNGYHGTMNGGFTVFNKRKAHIGGNSGAGFYFSSNPEDSKANYVSVEGADNHFKISHLAEWIVEDNANGGEGWNGFTTDDYDEAYEFVKKNISKDGTLYHTHLKIQRPYTRDYKNSTDIIADLYDKFDESTVDRNDFDDEWEYEDELSMERYDYIWETIRDAVYDALMSLEENYDYVSYNSFDSVWNAIIADNYESLTFKDIVDAFSYDSIEIANEDMTETADGSVELARQILEELGYDAIIDKEAATKFNQLKYMQDTEHYIVFSPNQIKLMDAITYDNDGNIIPLSERFSESNDIRYSVDIGENSERNSIDIDADDSSDFIKSRKSLQNTVDFYKEYVQYLGTLRASDAEIQKKAVALKRQYNSAMTVDEVKSQLNDIYTYLASGNVRYDEYRDMAMTLGKALVETENVKTNAVADDMLKKLKTVTVSITDEQRRNITKYYGNVASWLNTVRKGIKYSKEGTSLASQWATLCDMFPSVFDRDTAEADMPLVLADTIRALTDTTTNEYGYDSNEMAEMFALDFLDEYMSKSNRTKMPDKATRESFISNKASNAKRLTRIKTEAKNKQSQKFEDLKKTNRRLVTENVDLATRLAKQKGKMQEQKDTRERSMLRTRIRKNLNKILTMAATPTKDKHIPNSIVESVKALAEAVTLDGTQYDARLTDKLNRFRLGFLDDSIKKDSQYAIISELYNGYISEKIDELNSKYADTPLKELPATALREINDLIVMTGQSINNINRLFNKERNQTIKGYAMSAREELAQHRKELTYKGTLKGYALDLLKPVYFFEYLGSNSLTDLYNDLRRGEDTWVLNYTKARDYMVDLRKKVGYNNWDFKEKQTFNTMDGDVNLTLQQRLAIYANSLGEHTRKNLLGGGITVNEKNTTIKEAVKNKGKERNKSGTYRLTEDDLNAIVATLSDEQLKYVKDMIKFMSTTCAEWGNEVTRQLYGIELYKEESYYPALVEGMFRFDKAKDDKNYKPSKELVNKSFSKAIIPEATNPLILNDFENTVSTHIIDMASYNAFVLPLENFDRVYNYSTVGEDNKWHATKEYIQDAFTKQATKYIDNLIEDINGGAMASTDYTNKFISLFKKGAVFASASVVVQQPSAIGRALAILDAKYFVGNPTEAFKRADYNEMLEYCPIARIKELGYFDTGMAQSAVDSLNAKEYEGREKVKAFFTDGSYRDEALSFMAAKADEITWTHIWNACKKEAADKYGNLSAEEQKQKASERFTEIITKTQVYDSVFSRAGVMRNKNTGMKMATAFMAEPLTSLNMLANAITQTKRGTMSKGTAAKTVGSLVLASVINALLQTLVTAARHGKDDDDWKELYLAELLPNFLDNLNPAKQIPILRDVISIFSGYDVTRADMSVFVDLEKAVENLQNDNKKTSEKLFGLAGALGNCLGLPIRNVYRDVNAVVNIVKDMFDDYHFNDKKAQEKFKEEMNQLSTFTILNKTFGVEVFTTGTSSRYDKMFKAYEKGNTDKADKFLNEIRELESEKGKDEKEINSAIKTKFTTKYKTEYLKADEKRRKEIVSYMTDSGAYGSRSDVVDYIGKYWKE